MTCVLGFSQTRTVTNLNDAGPGSLRQTCYNANDGDTITFSPSLLANGSDTLHLVSNIILNKGLVFQGINTATDTLFISGSNQTQIFYFDLAIASSKDVVFNNMRFVDGEFSGPTQISGGCAHVANATTVRILNSGFSGCRSNNGLGGAVLVVFTDTIIVDNCVFSDNSATQSNARGGGLSIVGDYAWVLNSMFENNSSESSGGALRIYDTESLVYNTVFKSNSVVDSGLNGGGGAVNIASDKSITFQDCQFNDNRSFGFGGSIVAKGIFSDTSLLRIENCTFSLNESSTSHSGGGGAIYSSMGKMSIESCAFLNNGTNKNGGAIFIDAKYLNSNPFYYFNKVSFLSNSSDLEGTAIYVNGDAALDMKNITLHNPLTYMNDVVGIDPAAVTNFGIESSIIYGSSPNFGSNPTSLGHNIFSNAPSFAVATDQVNIDSTQLNLEPLADNGGFAPTRIPGPGSVALNMGTPTDFSPAQNGPIYERRDVGAAEARTIISDTLLACSPIIWWGSTYSTAGTYSDTVFNANSIDSVGILVLERQDTTIINQNAVLLALEDDTNTTYQWVDCDNNYAPIQGETNASFTPTTNGSYAVILTNGTCSDTSACLLYNEVSITEEDGQTNLRYYPNPTQGQLTIATTGELPTTVSIYDLGGREVGELELESNTLQLPELASGMYVLQWKWESGRVVASRVMVE